MTVYGRLLLNYISLVVISPVYNKCMIEALNSSFLSFAGIRKYSSNENGKFFDEVYFQYEELKTGKLISKKYEFKKNSEIILPTIHGTVVPKEYNTLKSGDVTLEPVKVTEEEIEKLIKWYSDPEVSIPYGTFKFQLNECRAKKTLEAMIKNHGYKIMKYDEFIGIVEIKYSDEINRTANIEILIGESQYFNKGIGTKAIEMMLENIYNNTDMNNILVGIFDFNKRSINLFKKVGFEEIYIRESAYYSNGKSVDMIYVQMTRDIYNKK